MAISSIFSSSASSRRPLIVENLRLTIGSALPMSSEKTSQHADLTSQRIQTLVSQIKDQFLDAAKSGGNTSSIQSSVDGALAEISQLLGKPLSLGGTNNAILKGVNGEQISRVEVLSLPSGSNARFSGGWIREAGPATTTVERNSALLSVGGSLEVNSGGRRESISIRPSTSLDALVSEINSRGLDVRAQVTRNGLDLISRRLGKSFTVVSRPEQRTLRVGSATVTGQNASQIASVDTGSFRSSEAVEIQGSRDSLATSAVLLYQGDGSGQAVGSASFDLSGRLGEMTLNVSKGESLADIASRINDASSSTGVVAEAIGDQLRLHSDTRGDSATIQVSNVVHQQERSISSINASQIERFDLFDIADDTEVTLAGNVTAVADSARLVYQGGPGGVVVDTATFTLTGAIGNAQVSITQNESLADVQSRINQASATTGISASISGNTLVFNGTDVGSAQSINVTLDDVTQYVDVSGVNAGQISNFTVQSSQPNSANTLEGSVTRAATKGELTYTGTLGFASSSASITLSGELGSAAITVNSLQSLTAVQNSINAVSGTTGVVASVSGNSLRLTSANVGSTATVNVDVQSGSFGTTGGDGNGNAEGLDAQANLNGNLITAQGNDFEYFDALGSYSFRVNNGFTGAISPITVTTTDGEFDITGGDGSGTAYGIDAEATINGQSLVAVGNNFSFSLGGADIGFTLTTGYIGSLDPITVRSAESEFSISGGDANGAATGMNGTATINGDQYTSADDLYAIDTAGGEVTVQFVADFVGSLDSISIRSDATISRRSYSAQTYRALGSSNVVTINGKQSDPSDNRYVVEQDGVKVAIEFAKGFSGQFDPFNVSAGGLSDSSTFKANLATLTGSQLQATQEALSGIFQLASGGQYSGLEGIAADALSIISEVASRVRQLSGEPASRGRSLNGILLDQYA